MEVDKTGGIGPLKTAHWIRSGLLPTRPDRITGSKDRYYIEFGIPEDWEKFVESDWRRLKEEAEWEIAEEDLGAWDMMCKHKGFENLFKGTIAAAAKPTLAFADADGVATVSVSAAASTDEVPEKTPGQLLAEQKEKLKANVQTNLVKFQGQLMKLQIIKTRCEASDDADMISSFIKALHGAITKNAKVNSLLERMLTQAVEDKELPKLLVLLEGVDERYESMAAWAVKFGCAPEPAGDAGRRKRGRGNGA